MTSKTPAAQGSDPSRRVSRGVGERPRSAAEGGGALRSVLVVGLTGGIASGKSTVAALLRESGAVVVDADRVGHEVLQPGEPSLAETIRHFGGHMLQADGTVDRRRLGEAVFGSESERQALNRITHGRIAAALWREVERIDREAAGPAVVVVEAALLFEAGWDRFVDITVATRAEQHQQVERLMKRHGLDHARAVARVRSQERALRGLSRADRVVDTSGSLTDTREHAETLWQTLLEAARARFTRLHGAHAVVPGEGGALPGAGTPHSSRLHRRN